MPSRAPTHPKFIIGILAATVAIMIAGITLYYSQAFLMRVASFEECAKAGYPILESFPRQCVAPGGKTFIEKQTPYPPKPGNEYKDRITQENYNIIINSLRSGERASVIVWLKNNEFTSPEYQTDLNKKGEEIKKIQDEVLNSLTLDDFKTQFVYTINNGFAGSVNESGFLKLLNHPLVVTIYRDRPVKIPPDMIPQKPEQN